MKCLELALRLPSWIENFLVDSERVYPTVELSMQLVITFARLNVEHQTGGPFRAGIFEQRSGRLIAVGVNQVESTNYSIAHAEILAIAFAQHAVECYDLGSRDGTVCELVTSTEPCAMCLGVVCWSGVRKVICGTRGEDAREI